MAANELMVTNAEIATAGTDIHDLINVWLGTLDVKPRSLESYKGAMQDFDTYLNDNGITMPTAEDIKAYKNDLAERINEKTGKPFSSSTVQLYVGTVKRFFKWTASVGAYPNVAANVKPPVPGRAHKKDYLTTNQVKDVLEVTAGDSEKALRDSAIIRLMVTTGVRTIEVVRANVEDLRPLGDMMVLYVEGKGRDDKSEYVEIPADLEAAIRKYLAKRGNVQSDEPLFTGVGNRAKTRMARETVSRIAKKAMQKAGISDNRHTAHSFRHTAATLNLMGGGTLEETRGLLRHGSLNTTLIYSHALENQGNHSASRIEKMILN